jgi:hypothetical protein
MNALYNYNQNKLYDVLSNIHTHKLYFISFYPHYLFHCQNNFELKFNESLKFSSVFAKPERNAKMDWYMSSFIIFVILSTLDISHQSWLPNRNKNIQIKSCVNKTIFYGKKIDSNF